MFSPIITNRCNGGRYLHSFMRGPNFKEVKKDIFKFSIKFHTIKENILLRISQRRSVVFNQIHNDIRFNLGFCEY